jgi:hypothetical protein
MGEMTGERIVLFIRLKRNRNRNREGGRREEGKMTGERIVLFIK